MTSRKIEAETIAFQKSRCTAEEYDALVKNILERMGRISDAQSCESECEENSEFPLVRDDRGV